MTDSVEVQEQIVSQRAAIEAQQKKLLAENQKLLGHDAEKIMSLQEAQNMRDNALILAEHSQTLAHFDKTLKPRSQHKKSEPINRWTMPFLVGACSGLVWIMQNGFVPFYNSFGAIWLGMFYGPALIGYLIYVLGYAMEVKRYHSENPRQGGLEPHEVEKINSECMWLGLKLALSLLGAQVASRIMYANGLAELIEQSMGGWSSRLLDTMPMEFHVGMMVASAIGFALCFVGLSYYQKGKLETKDMLIALGVGLYAGGGIYLAHLLPGMNHMYHWNIPEGMSLMIGAAANAAVLTTALAIKPSLVDVSGFAEVPVDAEVSGEPAPAQTSMFTSMYESACKKATELKEAVVAAMPSLTLT